MGSIYQGVSERILEIAQESLGGIESAPDRISIGGKATKVPKEVIVRELAENVSVNDRVTTQAFGMGKKMFAPLDLEFSVSIELSSTRAGLLDASNDVSMWWELIARGVAADRTLGGLVYHSVPYLSNSGSALRDNQYIAAIDGGVRCKAELCPLD
jgi:hypothetical protein